MKPQNRSHRTYRFFFILTLVVSTLGAVGWLVNTPMCADDFCYALEALPITPDGKDMWDCIGQPITTWGQVGSSIVNHFAEINTRIPNLLLFVFQMFPRAWAMGFCGLTIGVMYWLIALLGRVDSSKLSFRWIALSAVLLWMAFPWFDFMQSMAFVMNYVMPSVFFLLVVWLSAGLGEMTPRRFALLCLLTVVAGMMHEAFTLTLMAFLAVRALLCGGKARLRFALMVVLLGMTVVVALMFGTGARLGGSKISLEAMKYIITRSASTIWPFWLSFVLLGMLAFKQGLKRFKALLSTVLPYYGAVAGNIAVCMVLTAFNRALWPAVLCSVVVCLILVSELIGRGRLSRRSVAAFSAAMVLYIVWLGGVIHWERKIKAEFDGFEQAAARAAAKGDDVVFADMTYDDVPFWTMGMSSHNPILEVFSNMRAASYLHISDSTLAVLPKRFEHLTFDRWDTIPGNAGLRGCWPVVIAPDRESVQSVYMVTYGDATPSMTPIDRAYVWLRKKLGIPSDALYLKTMNYPLMVDGVCRCTVFFEPQARWGAHREVTSIDTVPRDGSPG